MVERDGGLVKSPHKRLFCGECGSHLWAHHDAWPELLHPVASAIDTELPAPTEGVHMMVGSKACWVRIEGQPNSAQFDSYPDESLSQWHDKRQLGG